MKNPKTKKSKFKSQELKNPAFQYSNSTKITKQAWKEKEKKDK